MEKLIAKLRIDFPSLTFEAGTQARWSPSGQVVTYVTNDEVSSVWSVLHELGHALLQHSTYNSDTMLVKMEAAAWDKATAIGAVYKIAIPVEHREMCLDTYRDWQHKRSTCPKCHSHGLQQSQSLYKCPNCLQAWNVTSARLCRPYRLSVPS